MGFSLAEASFNLVLPKDPQQMATVWANIGAFAASFSLIAVLWWYHHRLFATYFVLTPVSVTANFVMLGALALMIYFQQLFLHFVNIGAYPWSALRGWFAALTVVYGLLALMYAIGVVKRRGTLPFDDVRYGVVRTITTVWATVVFGVMSFSIPYFGSARTAAYVLAPAVLVLALVRRFAAYRFAGALAEAWQSKS